MKFFFNFKLRSAYLKITLHALSDVLGHCELAGTKIRKWGDQKCEKSKGVYRVPEPMCNT